MPDEPKAPTERPASRLLAMMLDSLEADFKAARAEAVQAEAELLGIDLSTAKFDPARRVWVLPISPE
jgi:hypothetical protein